MLGKFPVQIHVYLKKPILSRLKTWNGTDGIRTRNFRRDRAVL